MSTAKQLRQYCGPYGTEVAELTGISKDTIAAMIYELGMEWLSHEGLDGLAHAKAFWSDWKYAWYSRDAEFLGECYMQGEVIDYYRFHRKQIYQYSLDQAVVQKIRKQLKSESYE